MALRAIRGDLWSLHPLSAKSPAFVTTNSFIKKDGRLAMGRGVALEAKIRFPEIDSDLGSKIHHLEQYGVIFLEKWSIGAFQTKSHFRDPSPLSLIELSTKKLAELIEVYNWEEVALPFPGIGFGGRKIWEVLPILEAYLLDKPVTLYIKGEIK